MARALRAGKTFHVLVAFSLLALSGCGILEVVIPTPTAQTFVPSVTRTPPIASVPTPVTGSGPRGTEMPASTQEQEPEFAAANTIACPELTCIWHLDQEPPEWVSFDRQVEIVYDYSPATHRLLHGRFNARGAGPGNIAVTDLQFLDLHSGISRPIIPEENIAEAVWAPNGKNLAYVRATSRTYELHWLTEFGDDRLLASDVAFTFSVSPNGDRVAFTRESNYNFAGQPGIYVVEVDSGEEWLISNVDRAGAGSIADRPIWSADGTQILLTFTGETLPAGFVRAAVDGSGDAILAISPAVQGVIGRGSIATNLLWHPDNRRLIGQVIPDVFSSETRRIFSFELDAALEQMVSAELISEGEGELLGWAEPGLSVWIRREFSDLILAPLP